MNIESVIDDNEEKKWVEECYNPSSESKMEVGGETTPVSHKEELNTEMKEVVGEDKIKHTGNFSDAIQGFSSNRTFVIMGNNIVVYQTKEDNLEYLTTMPVVSSYLASHTPMEPMLYREERSLLLMDENQASIYRMDTVSYTHLRAHETSLHLVCRLLLEKKKKKKYHTPDLLT
eukprot:TRINITY_DN12521_c0_g1_i2.p2 TRINITY_DN12521_c0_g1~~TRINITY_DN12521_c0_g1_i2.p2  ORF type:complete len:174 (-),score=47.38 TRINITY_DN12521_c0_g1_i2:89-610(-)